MAIPEVRRQHVVETAAARGDREAVGQEGEIRHVQQQDAGHVAGMYVRMGVKGCRVWGVEGGTNLSE